MTNKKGVERVREFLETRRISAKLVELGESARTSALAAKALGCSTAEIAKSIVFAGRVTVVVITSGDRRVDVGRLSRVTGERLRIATAEEVSDRTGYVAGGVPPFPHSLGVTVLADIAMRRFERVWAAGGEQDVVLQISVEDLVNAVGKPEVDVSVGSDG